MKHCFFGGQVILPYRVISECAVCIEDGKIKDILPVEQMPRDAALTDLKGGYLLPGFVDIHVHGGGGYDIMDATDEALRGMAALHAAHGTTSLCPTTMTCPEEQLFKCIDTYIRVKQEGTGSADLLGLHFEGPYLSGANMGAQPGSFMQKPTESELDEIIARAGGNIARWDAAPELDGMELFARKMKQNGILCSIAHSAATAEETLEAYERGFTHITHMYCATTTEHKVGQAVHGGIIEAAYLEDGITVELIADGCHIPKETMRLGFKLKGDGGLALVTDAMRAAGTDVRESILGDKQFGVPVIIEDGVAKQMNRATFAGSIATMDHAFRTAHVKYGIDICDVVAAMSLTPARLVGADDRKGSIEVGKDADLVVMTPDFEIREVYVRGRKLA